VYSFSLNADRSGQLEMRYSGLATINNCYVAHWPHPALMHVHARVSPSFGLSFRLPFVSPSAVQFTYQPFENKRVELSVCHRDVCNATRMTFRYNLTQLALSAIKILKYLLVSQSPFDLYTNSSK